MIINRRNKYVKMYFKYLVVFSVGLVILFVPAQIWYPLGPDAVPLFLQDKPLFMSLIQEQQGYFFLALIVLLIIFVRYIYDHF